MRVVDRLSETLATRASFESDAWWMEGNSVWVPPRAERLDITAAIKLTPNRTASHFIGPTTAIPRSHFTSLGAPHRLTLSTLSSISSAPLASITLECWRQFPPNQTLQILGSSDSWFSQMAENATVGGSLVLTLTGWRESRV